MRELAPVARGGTVSIAACRIGGRSVLVSHPTDEPLDDDVTGWHDRAWLPPWAERGAAAMSATDLPEPDVHSYVDTDRDPKREFRVLAIAAALTALGTMLLAQLRIAEVKRLAKLLP